MYYRYALTSPTPSPPGCSSCTTSSSVSVQERTTTSSSSNSAYSYFLNAYSTSYEHKYYDKNVCASVGITVPEYLPELVFEDAERQFLQAKCDFLSEYNVYPRNIGPLIHSLSPEQLTYDLVLIGTDSGALSSLLQLDSLGKKIVILERGGLPPVVAKSMYYRQSLLNSQYVIPYEAYIPGCDVPKKAYSSNVVGATTIYDFNTWNYGSRNLYEELGKINSDLNWDNAYKRYQSMEYREQETTKETETNVTVNAQGGVSISTTVRETSVSKQISSVFSELGYTNDASGPLDAIDRVPGLSVVPLIGEEDRNVLYPYKIFSSLKNTNDIDMILGYEAEKILFDSRGRATGVQLLTPKGPVVISVKDEVLLGTGPISSYRLLFNSGVGDPSLLERFGIPVQSALPYLGQGLLVNPIYVGCAIRFPYGSLIQEQDTDFKALNFLFGESTLSSTGMLSHYAAFLSVQGSESPNIMMRFFAFSKNMSRRLQLYLYTYFQFDEDTVKYIMDMSQKFDLLFMSSQLVNPKSRGHIAYKDSINLAPYINLGLYSEEHDVDCMLEVIDVARKIADTQSFKSLGGELIQMPVPSFTGECFTEEYNRQSLLHHSIPNMHLAGGLAMGLDVQNACVDSHLLLHGVENIRVLSSTVAPFPLNSDSVAFSSLIGSYAAEMIGNGGSSLATTSEFSSMLTSSHVRDVDFADFEKKETTIVPNKSPSDCSHCTSTSEPPPNCACDQSGMEAVYETSRVNSEYTEYTSFNSESETVISNIDNVDVC